MPHVVLAADVVDVITAHGDERTKAIVLTGLDAAMMFNPFAEITALVWAVLRITGAADWVVEKAIEGAHESRESISTPYGTYEGY